MVYKEIPIKNIHLADVVESYWTLTPDRFTNIDTKRALIVPDGTVGMFLQSNSIYREYKGELSYFAGSYIFGQKSKPVYYHLTNAKVYCFGVKLKPQGMGKITKLPLAEFTDAFIETTEIFGQAAKEMEMQIQEAINLNDKIQIFEDFLCNQLPDWQNYDQMILEKALAKINQSKGFAAIIDICNALNIGYKKLEKSL